MQHFSHAVAAPNPQRLQQAIGRIEGEIRRAMQYFFQAMASRRLTKYRDLLIGTATEELLYIECRGYAVAHNLEDAPLSTQEDAAEDPVVNAILVA